MKTWKHSGEMKLLAGMLALLLCAKLCFPTYVQLASADDALDNLVICTSTRFSYQVMGDASGDEAPMATSECVWCQSWHGMEHLAAPLGDDITPTVRIGAAEKLVAADERVALAALPDHYRMRAPPL